MPRVYLDLVDGKWNEVAKSNFWIDGFLLSKLENMKKIQAKKWDGVLLVDGKERSGKSVLAMIMGWYLSECKMTKMNFASGLNDAAEKIGNLPDGSVLVVDEGSIIFSSKDSSNNEQKKLIKLLDVIGQKNMIFIVCLPCIFDLNKTIAVRRSLFLCHVYPDEEYNRGNFVFFGEKKKAQLYKHGKKNYDSYSYPEADFAANYFEFAPPFYQEYLEEVKKNSLAEVLASARQGKPSDRQILTFKINEALKRIEENKIDLTLEQTAKILGVHLDTIFKHKQALKNEKVATCPPICE